MPMTTIDLQAVGFYKAEAARIRLWLQEWPVNNVKPHSGAFGDLHEPWNVYRARMIREAKVRLSEAEYAIDVLTFQP